MGNRFLKPRSVWDMKHQIGESIVLAEQKRVKDMAKESLGSITGGV